MESKINARMSKKTRLVYQGFAEDSFSVNIPNYQNYDMLEVIINGGDIYRGTEITIPRVLYDVQIPFSVYGTAQSPVPVDGGYSIAVQGSVGNGVVNVVYAYSGIWGVVYVTVYGIS